MAGVPQDMFQSMHLRSLMLIFSHDYTTAMMPVKVILSFVVAQHWRVVKAPALDPSYKIKLQRCNVASGQLCQCNKLGYMTQLLRELL